MCTIAHDTDKIKRTQDVHISEDIDFTGMLLSESVLQGLQANKFKKPSPIQLKAIPIGRCGLDLVIQAKSGTGKTIVFGILTLEAINTKSKCLQALILAPTREIAIQIQQVLTAIGSHTPGLKVESFIGGLPLEQDIAKLKMCHIAVGAPGRIKHLIDGKHIKTKEIKMFVMDEADQLLLSSSHKKDVDYIFNQLPKKKQVIASSATYPTSLESLICKYIESPMVVNPDSNIPVLMGLRQYVSLVQSHLNVMKQIKIKIEELTRILSTVSFKQCIVFSNYQTRAESISNNLSSLGWPSIYISGLQDQNERLNAMKTLKEFKCRVLLSTDLIARGIDAENVNLVINFDVPYNGATYLHRIGRAGRFGSQGLCITICGNGDEQEAFQKLLGTIDSQMSVMKFPTKDEMPDNIWTCNNEKFDKINSLNDNEEKSDMYETQPTIIKQGRNRDEKSESAYINEEKLLLESIPEVIKKDNEISSPLTTNTDALSKTQNSESNELYGSPMLQDLSTTPSAMLLKAKREEIIQNNMSLLEISKLVVNTNMEEAILNIQEIIQFIDSNTVPNSLGDLSQKLHQPNSTLITFDDISALVERNELRTDNPDINGSTNCDIVDENLEPIMNTKVTDRIMSRIDHLLSNIHEQQAKNKYDNQRFRVLHYTEIAKCLLDGKSLEEMLSNHHAKNKSTKSVKNESLRVRQKSAPTEKNTAQHRNSHHTFSDTRLVEKNVDNSTCRVSDSEYQKVERNCNYTPINKPKQTTTTNRPQPRNVEYSTKCYKRNGISEKYESTQRCLMNGRPYFEQVNGTRQQDWHEMWKAQVIHVRQYVQQAIYIQEMMRLRHNY